MRGWLSPSILLAVALLASVAALSGEEAKPPAGVAEPTRAQIEFFERKIRPVLVEKCYQCHSAKAKSVKGGLLLDTRDGLRKGGDTGEAIVPGDAEKSLLIHALRYDPDGYQMPPSGKLPAAAVADFEKWVAMGAPDPRDGKVAADARPSVDLEAGRDFWSLQPPQRHVPPPVQHAGWVRQPIDAFILARLEAAGLSPSPEADRRTFIRRASFDLLGLPPTPETVQAFVDDASPDAYEKLIDRLLESPHYGERWGRHWLDVARYAEDNTNMGPYNGPYPHAWRYRDWVVRALNDDVPYDDFIRRQLATDLMDSTGLDDVPALGLIGLAPSYHKELLLAKVVVEGRYADEWEDRVDSIGRGLLGLTLACARCHDHKYDPVTMSDYYALAGVFASARQAPRPIISPEEVAKTQPLRDKAAELQTKVGELEKEATELEKKVKAQEKATAAGAEAGGDDAKARLAKARDEIAKKKAEIETLQKTPGFEVPMADAVLEETTWVEAETPDKNRLVYKPEPRDLPVFVRGDVSRPGPVVPRRFLEVLSQGEPQPFEHGSGRLELAEAIVRRDTPLTARVIVNRVWQHHFGRGLVDSPSNFGRTGSMPSHPELLDDLAVRFMEQGWSLKTLHREIMLSATYRQSSANNTAGLAADADNRLLWRFSRRRLEVEAYRDAILAASGRLDLTIGGPSGDADDPAFVRRTVYAMISRHKLSDTLQAFDFPDPAIHCDRRVPTTTPLQQLFVMNSPFMRQNAMALAHRLLELPQASLAERVTFAYETLFARPPTDAEMAIAGEFLGDVASGKSAVAQTPAADSGGGERASIVFDGHGRATATLEELPDNYSAEMWVLNTLATSVRPVTAYFLSRGVDGDADAAGDHLGISGTYTPGAAGKLLFFNGNKLQQALVGKTSLAPNTWNHVVLVREGDAIRVYLNGNPEPEIAGQAQRGYAAGSRQVVLGCRNDGFAPLEGKLAEAAVYDRALTVDEIAAHYQAARLDQPPNDGPGAAEAILKSKPLAYWRQTEASATRLTDRSGHDSDAQLAGAASGPQEVPDQTLARWAEYAQALLAANELLYID